jgi:hypothetical protein
MKETMKDIDKLYRKLLLQTEGHTPKLDGKVRAEIFRKITDDLERLQEEQGGHSSWTLKYRKIDREIRRRLLMEIQIIVDDYTVAKESDQLARWEKMYGDIEHYKKEFYRIRMDSSYEKKKEDVSRGTKFVKGEWEKVEFMKLR